MHMIRRTSMLALALGAGAAVFALTSGSGTTTDPSADRAELLASVTGGAAAFSRDYARVADMLPNVKDSTGGAACDSVVVGTISSVVDEAGYVELNLPNAPTTGRAGARVTLFDDPLAHWRTMKVTIDVEETLAGPKGSTLEFSWGVLGNSRTGQDKAAVGRALKALGRIVLITKAHPTGPEYLGIDRVLPDKVVDVMQVSADGSLSLPFAAGDGGEGGFVDGVAFLAGLDTLDELRTEAAKPNHPFPYPPA